MDIVQMKLSDLVPYEKNPRNNDKAVEAVATSIEEFGFKVPMVVTSEGVIIAGHTRYKAAHMLGMESVPVVVADDLSDEQIKAFRLADNRVAENSEWDEDLLEQELRELLELDFDLDKTGFDEDELDRLLNEDSEDEDNIYTDKVETPQYEPTGEEVTFQDMVDNTKTEALMLEIEESNLDKDEKKFLKMAAQRHLQFNYKNIAEYYAQAREEVQELMERSALVIIDYEDAIRNGYVSLSNALKDMADLEEE